MKIRSFTPAFWAGALVLLGAALLYVVTLDNGFRPDELTGGDLITHQYAQVEARPSNAPGYPLYTMGGWLWFHSVRWLLAPLANPIQVLSLYSTLWGLASLLLLYLILWRVTARRWWLAALLTAFHATTYFFWYYSVTTEQYTSATFQTLLLIWLAFKWDDQPRHSTLLWMAFVSGTMLANMVTTLFILPPLLWFILVKKDDSSRGVSQNPEIRDTPSSRMLTSYLRQPKLALQAVGLALLPLLSYVYVFVRGVQHPEWRGQGQWPSAWAWFVDFLTIQQGRDELAPGLSLQSIFTAEFPALMWHELTVPVFLGGLLGLAFLGRRRAIFLYSTLIIYFVFCWGYRFGNWFQVIIPAYPIFTVGFGVLLARLLAGVELARPKARLYLPPLVSLLLVGLVIFNAARNLPRANQRNRPTDTGLAPGWAILADSPTPPAAIAADFAERVALQYLTVVWEAAPGIIPLEAGAANPGVPNFYVTRRAAAAAPHRIDPTTETPQAAGVQLVALPAAPPLTLPPSAQPAALDFGGVLKLAGWEQVEPESGNAWQLALYWQAEQPPPADYTVSVRPQRQGQPITAGGQPVIQDHPPVWGLYPTHQWRPGEIVRDVYALTLPAGVTPDAVQIVVYRATETGFENLADHTLSLMDSSP